MTDEIQYCSFQVGDLLLGVDVRRVQEVLRQQPMTRVPLAPPQVRGLINLRGQIVPAIDLGHRLGVQSTGRERQMNVVVRDADGPASLLVDEIGDVITPDPKAFEAPPSTLRGPIRELIVGVYKLEGRLMLALDTEKAVDVSQESA